MGAIEESKYSLVSLDRIIRSRRFGLVDLGCVILGGMIWYGWNQYITSPGLQSIGGWAIFIALLPWVARLRAGHFPFKRTGFDLLMAVFLITALIGVWAAYDRSAAWRKFVPIVIAVLLYYSLAGQPKGSSWIIANLLCLFGLLLAIYFLFSYDWQGQPVKFWSVSRVASAWTAIRPVLPLPRPDSDVVAGLLAVLSPFPLVVGLRNWHSRERGWAPVLFSAFSAFAILICLFLAAERGPWLGLILAIGVWVLWKASPHATRLIDKLHFHDLENSQGFRQPRHLPVFLFGLAFTLLLLVWIMLNYSGDVAKLADRLPGPAEAAGRVELWQNASRLIADFPITGGGLAGFPGLYSQYLLVIPLEFLESSHNLFLDVAIEQGVFGLLALVSVLAGCLWYLIRSMDQPPEQDEHLMLRGALAAGLLILIVEGLVDNALYSSYDVWALFLLPGFTRVIPPSLPAWHGLQERKRLVGAVCFIAILGLLSFSRILLSTWYSDLGAVSMARVELSGFPTGKWEDTSIASDLATSARWLETSIRLNPNNRTAQHRLGLINLLQGDYPSAIGHLEKANQLDRAHRGIRKSLAYSYVWAGRIDKALPLLIQLPETKKEMEVYISWWEMHGHPELGAKARQVRDKLGQISLPLE